MGIHHKFLEWNEDLEWLQENAWGIFHTLNAQNTDFGQVINGIWDLKDDLSLEQQRFIDIMEKYDLMEHCYMIISTADKLVHDPHNHKAEDGTKVTLLIPIAECDENTVTSFVQPVNSVPTLATDDRTSNVLHPDEEYTVIESFSVTDKPLLLDNNQWHMMVSTSDVTQRVTFAWPMLGDFVKSINNAPL